MSKVTSKLQVTIPKAIAVKYRIHPGDDVRWEELPRGVVMVRIAPDARAGEGRVSEGVAVPTLRRPGIRTARDLTPAERLAIFDEQTRWLANPRKVEAEAKARRRKVEKERGWSREDLYEDRGHSR